MPRVLGSLVLTGLMALGALGAAMYLKRPRRVRKAAL